MKFFLEIITNPFGIAINVIYWTMVIFTFYWEGHLLQHEATYFIWNSASVELIKLFNTIPLKIIEIIAYPIDYLFGKNELINTHLQFLLIFIAIFQCSLIGYVINFLIDFHKPKAIKISLD